MGGASGLLILVDEIKRNRLTIHPPFAPSNGLILVSRIYVLLSISIRWWKPGQRIERSSPFIEDREFVVIRARYPHFSTPLWFCILVVSFRGWDDRDYLRGRR